MTTATTDREIILSRTFDAPRELVWKAFTDRRHVGAWFGPDGFTTTTHEMDVRAGGTWRYTMHGPDGTDYANRVDYVEVTPPERLVYDHGGDYGGATLTPEFRVTVTFVDREGKTELTMRSLFPTAADRDYVVKEFGAIEGGQQTLARLAEYLRTM